MRGLAAACGRMSDGGRPPVGVLCVGMSGKAGVLHAVIAAVVLAAGGISPATAAGADLIEGTWHFQGGQILVSEQTPGTFAGVVTRETRFAECPHPIGQRLWDIKGGADSYHGTHVGYRSPTCPDEGGGQSTWTIMDTEPSNFVLRFCSNTPGAGPVQTDDAGNPVGTTRCFNLTRAKPPAGGDPAVAGAITLPSKQRCLSRGRSVRIRLVSRRKDPLVKATVFLNKRKLHVTRLHLGKRKRVLSRVGSRRLPRVRVTVRVVAATRRGRTVVASRRYPACAPTRALTDAKTPFYLDIRSIP